ncbi:hypothetical protein [Siminovitchia sp. 179-K 8D1 HS]|uniref:hypothetical protein n=1 Tax=Siminovitchia sp. 179-K 8D1 HS TaxID=3142385 RepID=UPI0039A395E8
MFQINELSSESIHNLKKLQNYSMYNYKRILYCEIESKIDFKNFLWSLDYKQILIGIIVTKRELQDLRDVVNEKETNIEMNSNNKVGINKYYVELLTEKNSFLNNIELLEFLFISAEANDILFIIIDPVLDYCFFNFKTNELFVDTAKAKAYISFDYDASGLIIIE